MSWTTDRSIRDDRLLLALVIVIVCIAAIGGFFIWSRMNAPDASQKQAGQSVSPLIQPAFRDEPVMVKLYYPQDGMIVSALAPATRQPDSQSQAREALAAVFLDQRAMQAPVLRDVKLKTFYLDAQGTAYIDLTQSKQQAILASAWDEQLAVYALVDTLMQNFEEIKQVAFLVDGREAQTLAGHIDLSKKFTKRTELVKQ